MEMPAKINSVLIATTRRNGTERVVGVKNKEMGWEPLLAPDIPELTKGLLEDAQAVANQFNIEVKVSRFTFTEIITVYNPVN